MSFLETLLVIYAKVIHESTMQFRFLWFLNLLQTWGVFFFRFSESLIALPTGVIKKEFTLKINYSSIGIKLCGGPAPVKRFLFSPENLK